MKPYDIGEGMALFRWRTIQLDTYIVRECREKLMGTWPILAEWPPEKKRRAEEIIDAQHEETGRMWRGPRAEMPRRYFQVRRSCNQEK